MKHPMTFQRRFTAGMAAGWLAAIIPSLGAGDPEILQRVREALRQRSEVLHHYSVVVVTQRRGLERGGGEARPQEVRHYFGEPGQFKSEPVAGGRVFPGRRGRGGRADGGRGGSGRPAGLQIFQQGDLLSRIDPEVLLKGARIKGREGDQVQIQVQARLDQVRFRDGLLTVAAETGSPIRFQTRFSANRGLLEGRLLVVYGLDPRKQISVAQEQEAELEPAGPGGFPGGRGDVPRDAPGRIGGGGPPLRLSIRWSDYDWDLNFAKDFFEPEIAPEAPGNPALRTRSTPSATPSPNPQVSAIEDPFEEIRIRPPRSGEADPMQAPSGREEVLIEGGAGEQDREPGGFGEGRLMNALMGGSGAGGFDRGGGLRGARIAGSRANGLQGALSLTLSGSSLDARPYALNGQETERPGYLTWQAGATIGGPLGAPPPSSNRGGRGRGGARASFFVDFSTDQGNRLQSQFGTVPTLLERIGNFSQSSFGAGPLAGTRVRIVDPESGQPFPDATIPVARLNPAAQAILQYVPLPNREDPVLNYFRQSRLPSQGYRINGRLNAPLLESLRINSIYNINLSDRDQFSLFPDLAGSSNGRGQRLSLRFNHNLGEGFTHNPSIDWNRNRNRTLNPFAFNSDIAAELGFQDTSAAPIDFGLPTLEFTNFSDISDGSSRLTISESNSLSDGFNLIWGRHFFRIGGDVTWRRRNLFGNPSGTGTLTFAGGATSQFSHGAPRADSGYDLADFLLGLAQSSRIQYGNSDHYLRRTEFSLYVNDNWRALSRLTVQWGLRYQYTPPWAEAQGRIANLDIAPGFGSAETVVPGQAGPYFGTYPDGLVKSDRNNLSPRIGIAYRLRSGKYPSVLRSSYGIFYPDEAYNYFGNEFISQPPFGYTVQESVQSPPFLEMETAFGSQFEAEVANTFAADPNFRLPLVQNWDLSWQQALPGSFFISVGYAGSRGVGLEQLRAPNRSAEGGDRIAGAAEFLYLTSGAGSTFHGLQVLATRRMRAGFSFSAQYEFGKSIDNASAIAGGSRTVAQDDSNLDAERSRSSFDERHKLQLTGFLELPFGDRRRWLRQGGLAASLLSNWYLNGTLRASSGTPFTARLQGNRISNSGTASQASERADATGMQVTLDRPARTVNQWFNTAAFTIPAAGMFGNAGRNSINGPGSWNIDMNLARAFGMGREGRRLILMLRSRNVLNHPNYRGLNTTVNSTAFGRITSVGAMRSVEVNLRYIF